MTNYQVKVLRNQIICQKTNLLRVEKPQNFEFTPGQFLELTIKNEKRYLSIANSTTDNFLEFATRISSSKFKIDFEKLADGDTVAIGEPIGRFILKTTARPRLFLTGGIGITPFRSFIQEDLLSGFPIETWLFYANDNIEKTAFFAELKKIRNTNFHFVPIMTKDNYWEGEKGIISQSLLKKYLSTLINFDFYLAGPPSMVIDLKNVLLSLNIPAENIIYEEFIGY